MMLISLIDNVDEFLADLHLEKGNHTPDHTFCVLEAIAYIAREPWSDHPVCVSPAIGAFMRSWNDSLDVETRQKLKPYALKVIGTATGPADEERRAWLATDWLVREFTSTWLDLAGLKDHAANLRALPELETTALANVAIETIDAARDAARDAAGAAARDAAWAAAGAAARDAAWAAARDALAPTVLLLQESAFALLDRLILVGKAEPVPA